MVEALWWTVGDEVFPVGATTTQSSTEGAPSLPKVTLGQVTEALLQTAKAAPRINHLEIEYLFQKSKEVLGKESVQFDGDWLGKYMGVVMPDEWISPFSLLLWGINLRFGIVVS